jgi:AcrR family transcriptional regulator
MASPRRIGTETSPTRAALLDAAADLMLEEGYAAVTSRRLAEKAGLKAPLVHYYFRTMDDLFIALFRRLSERGLERQAKALASDQPLWSLWEFVKDDPNTALTMELLALANHRKALRAEIATSGERFRGLQLEVVSRVLQDQNVDPATYPPIAVIVLMSSISRFLVMEEAFGISAGHAETIALVEHYLAQLEGPRPNRSRAVPKRRSPASPRRPRQRG